MQSCCSQVTQPRLWNSFHNKYSNINVCFIGSQTQIKITEIAPSSIAQSTSHLSETVMVLSPIISLHPTYSYTFTSCVWYQPYNRAGSVLSGPSFDWQVMQAHAIVLGVRCCLGLCLRCEVSPGPLSTLSLIALAIYMNIFIKTDYWLCQMTSLTLTSNLLISWPSFQSYSISVVNLITYWSANLLHLGTFYLSIHI